MANRTHDLLAQTLLGAFDGMISIPPDPKETAKNLIRVVEVVKAGMEAYDMDTTWISGVYGRLLEALGASSNPLAYMALGAAKDRVREVAEGGWDG